MKTRTAILMAVSMALLVSCGENALVTELSSSPPNMARLVELASQEKPQVIDGVHANDGTPLLAILLKSPYATEESKALGLKLIKDGASVIFDGERRFALFNAYLQDDDYAGFESVLRAKLGSAVPLKFLEFLESVGYSYHESDGRTADFFLYWGNQDVLDQLIASQGYNHRFLRHAAVANDMDLVKTILSSKYLLGNVDILALADSGNVGALTLGLQKTSDVDLSDVLRESVDRITRSALLILFPRVPSDFNAESYINRLLEKKKYDCAAFVINYQHLILGDHGEAFDTIAGFLSEKPFDGGARLYQAADFVFSDEVVAAMDQIGVSPYLLLRNEIFARKGYIPTNPALGGIMNRTTWYRPIFNVTVADLTPVERQNVALIRKLEADYDVKVVVQWLNDKPYTADERIFSREEDFQVPNNVFMSLGNLGINPSALLREEIYTRRGLISGEPKFEAIFPNTVWYPDNPHLRDASVDQSTYFHEGSQERTNLLLLQAREWIEILDAQKQTLPDTIESVPVVGYNAMFLKDLPSEVGELTLSTNSLSYAVAASEKLLEGKPIGFPQNADRISAEREAEIAAIDDPLNALQTYFSEKTYAGTLDSYIAGPQDLEPPAYLVPALDKLDAEWLPLLRKEIHARHGAIFSPDTLAGKVFTSVPWYQPRYNLVSTTPSRLPNLAGMNAIETLNFLLIEGRDLRSLQRARANEGVVAFDLGGNSYAIRVAGVENLSRRENSASDRCYLGFGFQTNEGASSVTEQINEMLIDLEPPVEEAYYEEGSCG